MRRASACACAYTGAGGKAVGRADALRLVRARAGRCSADGGRVRLALFTSGGGRFSADGGRDVNGVGAEKEKRLGGAESRGRCSDDGPGVGSADAAGVNWSAAGWSLKVLLEVEEVRERVRRGLGWVGEEGVVGEEEEEEGGRRGASELRRLRGGGGMVAEVLGGMGERCGLQKVRVRLPEYMCTSTR